MKICKTLSAAISPNVPIIDIKPGTVDEATAKVLRAINARRSIQIDYTNLAGEESTRVIDPITLIDSDGHPAVLAWCHNANAQRNFRIDRMRRIEQLEGPITAAASEMFENIDSLSDNPYNPQETDHDVVIEVAGEPVHLGFRTKEGGRIQDSRHNQSWSPGDSRPSNRPIRGSSYRART